MSNSTPDANPRQGNRKTPSEKHLEDWIVANLQWFGPIYPQIWFPDDVLATLTKHAGENVIFPVGTQIIARQPKLPHGRPDLILKSEQSVIVTELKKGAIDSYTVSQCLRYMYDLEQILLEALEYDNRLFNRRKRTEIHAHPVGEITGVVVGHSLADRNLQTVCDLSNIMILTYEFDGLDYYFNHEQGDDDTLANQQAYRDWAQGALGEALREIIPSVGGAS